MSPFPFYPHWDFCVRKVGGKIAWRDDSEQKVSEGHIGPLDAQTLIVHGRCIDVIENAVRGPPPTTMGVIKIALHSLEVSLWIRRETEVWVIEIWTSQNLWLWNGTAS